MTVAKHGNVSFANPAGGMQALGALHLIAAFHLFDWYSAVAASSIGNFINFKFIKRHIFILSRFTIASWVSGSFTLRANFSGTSRAESLRLATAGLLDRGITVRQGTPEEVPIFSNSRILDNLLVLCHSRLVAKCFNVAKFVLLRAFLHHARVETRSTLCNVG